MNKTLLIGNLTRDPELKTTPAGVSVCSFSVAVNRNFTNANGEREVDFFNVVTWRGLAENCAKYMAKGRKAAIFGHLQTRSYDDRDGNKRTVTEIVAEDVEFLTPKDNEAQKGQAAPQAVRSKSFSDLQPADNDDLPF